MTKVTYSLLFHRGDRLLPIIDHKGHVLGAYMNMASYKSFGYP